MHLRAWVCCATSFFFQAEDGIRDAQESRGLGDVYKRQGLGGRRHRGRLFMPPFNLEEDQISNAGQLGTTYMASQVTKWGDVWDAWVAALLLPVLLHTDTATTATAITAFVPQSLAASQRRRMR